MLEWQRSQNHEDQEERGETRMIVPVEEIGEEERREERIVQGHTVKITKFPREKDDLLGTVENICYCFIIIIIIIIIIQGQFPR